MKFRKKPVVIEAVRVDDALKSAALDWSGLPDWLRSAYESGNVVFAAGVIYIQTLEGSMEGKRGDWIIRGVKGELYPCKPDIFEATYDSVDEAAGQAS